MTQMFKLYIGSKAGRSTNAAHHSNRESHGSEGSPHKHRVGKQRDLILTNILEEGSTVDEPRSFEQDEKYLDECLKVLDGNPEAAMQEAEGDLEEYDFDDYNSIASTASLVNMRAELAQENVTHSYLQINPNAAFSASQPKSTFKENVVINGSESSPFGPREELMRISKMQASISKVNNWSKFGLNGAPSKDEWRDVFLDAAQDGDLKTMQEAYSKLGGTSELTIRITDSDANTALHKAAEADSLPCLQWLVRQLPNDCLRNIINHENHTPLAVALRNGSIQCVQWLLEGTSAANEMTDATSRFALFHLSIQNGQDDCLKYLLAYVKDKCLELGVTDSSGVTLAHVAARNGYLTCIQTLVDHNFDVTIPDKDGRSPADYAYTAGQTGCARYLVLEESCWLLSVRIAKLHKELKDCKEENKALRQRLEVLESRARSGMPDRPEAVGEDPSDTSSTGFKKADDRLGTRVKDSPRSERSRAIGSPDGESPKGFGSENSAYNGSDHNIESRMLPARISGLEIPFMNKESEVKSARQFEALKEQRRLEKRGSIDSTGSGVSSPASSLPDTKTDSDMQQVMAKQIAANTRRLVMSKHAQKVEESPLIRIKPIIDMNEEVTVEEPRKGFNLQVIQRDIYYSPSSSRSHSPARADSTSDSRPTSGTPRKLIKTNKMKTNRAKQEMGGASEERLLTPSRIRSPANRRQSSPFSSDSTLSSESDGERSGQRSKGPRHRQGKNSSNRTKEISGKPAVSLTNLPEQLSSREIRAKKTVSWNESLKASTPTNLNKRNPDETPRIAPKPPVRTVSRDIGASRTTLRDSETVRKASRDTHGHGYLQVPRTSPHNVMNKSVDKVAVPSLTVEEPFNSLSENAGMRSSLYSLDGYQQDDRPWYETDEFD